MKLRTKIERLRKGLCTCESLHLDEDSYPCNVCREVNRIFKKELEITASTGREGK